MSDKEASTSGIVATTTPVVQAFPALTEARKFKSGGRESGEPKYSDSFVFDPASPDLQRLKAAAVAQAQAKWPGRDIGAEFKAGTFAMPFTSGNGIIAKTKAKAEAAGKEYDGKADFMKDKIIIKASSKYPRASPTSRMERFRPCSKGRLSLPTRTSSSLAPRCCSR